MPSSFSDFTRESISDTLTKVHRHSQDVCQQTSTFCFWGRTKGFKRIVDPVLVIHGGAGTFTREQSTPEKRELYRNALREALLRGHEVLQAGGEAMDAAVAAVTTMESKFPILSTLVWIILCAIALNVCGKEH